MSNSVFGLMMTFTSAVLVGCSSTPVAPLASSKPSAAIVPAVQSTSASSQALAPSVASLPAYLDPNNPISTQRSVYFDFDDFSVKNEYRGLIERQGKYLSSMPKLSIRIEGNTDERGSAEYNLALGQKRAEAVRKALEIFGVKDSQLEAVSWGSEHPKASGHDEAAWAQNRRVDLAYPKS